MEYSKLSQFELARCIRRQRERLKRAYEKHDSLTHEAVIAESQKLDVMIVYYQKFYGKRS